MADLLAGFEFVAIDNHYDCMSDKHRQFSGELAIDGEPLHPGVYHQFLRATGGAVSTRQRQRTRREALPGLLTERMKSRYLSHRALGKAV